MRILIRKIWVIGTVLFVWPLAGLSADNLGKEVHEETLIVRPIGGQAGFATETIYWKILKLALHKSGQAYDLAPSLHTRLVQREADQMRELGNEGNIIWNGMVHPQRDEMQRVAIPLVYGLASYRYLWVRTPDVLAMSSIRTKDDLKKYPILTGQNWNANYILEAEGFELRKGQSASLPGMLLGGRGDVLLWPVAANANLYEQYGVDDLDMTPLPNVVLRLPQAINFFVADSGSQKLHDTVALGLSTAIADGSLDELIRTFPFVGDAYANLLANDFVVIDIENPDLSEKVLGELDMYGVKVAE